MPRYIVKIPHDGVDYYLEWSTIVDAPVTYGMPLEEFSAYMAHEHGSLYMNHQHSERMERVEQTGTSSLVSSLEALLSHNFAGEGETHLTLNEIIQEYIVKPRKDKL